MTLSSCDGPTKEDKAEALYDRICAVVFHDVDNDYITKEWKNIKNKIIEDKDTLFMVNSPDFQILVRKTVSLKNITTDTTKVAPAPDSAKPITDSSKKASDDN